MKSFEGKDEGGRRAWLLRIASLAALFAAFGAIGFFFRRGDALLAGLLVATVPAFAVLFSLAWTGSLFSALEGAKRYVRGAEGGHRHEWYAFKSQRVRVYLDDMQRPWFPVNEIGFILDLKVDKDSFRHYGPQEYAIPESTSEPHLSESGLRRLIKYSAHPDAGALHNWLEREVLRMLRNRKARQA